MLNSNLSLLSADFVIVNSVPDSCWCILSKWVRKLEARVNSNEQM